MLAAKLVKLRAVLEFGGIQEDRVGWATALTAWQAALRIGDFLGDRKAIKGGW